MEVVNCKECGRLFNYLQGPRLCNACVSKLEEKFQQVKAYLEDHPNSNMDDISKDNDVSIKQIKQWIREERLTFSKDSLQGIECEQCGAMIRTGRFCDNCKGKMQNNLQSVLKKPEAPVVKKRERDGERMRFLQNNGD